MKKISIYLEKNLVAAFISFILFSLVFYFFTLGEESFIKTIKVVFEALAGVSIYLFLIGIVSSLFADYFFKKDLYAFFLQIVLTLCTFPLADMLLTESILFKVLLMSYPLSYYISKKLKPKVRKGILLSVLALFIIVKLI